MARTYSITEAARLLGVSAATVSRRLPAERASRGRSADLSLQEVIDVARAAHVDPETVQRRALLDAEFGPDMPADARRWAEIAVERGLLAALAPHFVDFPSTEVETAPDLVEELLMSEPWGDPSDWTPIRSQEELEALVPPIRLDCPSPATWTSTSPP